MTENQRINQQIETAVNYSQTGWYPIPVKYEAKDTRTPNWSKVKDDWQKDTNTAYNIKFAFGMASQNVGIVLGKASNGLIDIDIDAPEILGIADRFLPKTAAIFGRKSKPKSHYLYYCSDAETKKFEGEGTIIELRSDGCYTVFPGSIHPSGESVEWFEQGTPSRTEYDALRRGASKLAAIKLIIQNWKHGTRHDTAMALSGALARHGWSDDEITQFIEAICDAAKDDQKDDRLRCAADTLQKYEAGEKTTGIPKLCDLIGRDAVCKICDWLEIEFVSGNTKLKDAPNEVICLIEQSGIELFQTSTLTPYAKVSVRNHFEIVQIDSANFSDWVERFWYSLTKKPIRPTTLAAVVSHYRTQAKYDAPQKETSIRVAEFDGKTYLDLTDETWQAVEIDGGGWRVIDSKDCPVMFRRTSGMLPMPIPEKGGRIDDLRQYINVTDESFVLIKGYLLGCLNPNIPYPILSFSGEQSSAKTTACEIVRWLIDNHAALTTKAPKDEDDMMIAAQNSYVNCYDNLSYVKRDLSDALCRMSTGAGAKKRMLFTDTDETIIHVRRPVILNGITEILTKPDVISRAIFLECPPIARHNRKSETQIKADFRAAHSKLLGALLDAVVMAKKGNGYVPIEHRTRMIDFQLWVASGETALGMESGEFNRLYATNASEGLRAAESNEPLFQLILKFMGDKPKWFGTATDLLQKLKEFSLSTPANTAFMPIEQMPKLPQNLSSYLKRFAPNLRENGIEYAFGKSGGRQITLTKRAA